MVARSLREMNKLAGEATVSKTIFASHVKEVLISFILKSRFFPFGETSVLEGAWCWGGWQIGWKVLSLSLSNKMVEKSDKKFNNTLKNVLALNDSTGRVFSAFEKRYMYVIGTCWNNLLYYVNRVIFYGKDLTVWLEESSLLIISAVLLSKVVHNGWQH